MVRAAAVVERVDRVLAAAQTNVRLKFFNQAYRQYRVQAQGARPLMYNQAFAKLRRALFVGMAHSTGATVEWPSIARIFALPHAARAGP
jgi:hypothetical protein